MMHRVILVPLLLLGLAGPALAGSLIVTPALSPPAGGSVSCLVANGSPTKEIEYTATIYEFNGDVAATSASASVLSPNNNLRTDSGALAQGHCVVEVTSGPKSSVRVSLQVKDAAGNILAAVSGQ